MADQRGLSGAGTVLVNNAVKALQSQLPVRLVDRITARAAQCRKQLKQ
jgi:hypothetical protein